MRGSWGRWLIAALVAAGAPAQFAQDLFAGTVSAVAAGAAGTIAIVDRERGEVTLIGAAGSRETIGGRGHGEGEFDRPSGVALAPGGKLFVSDTGNDRICIHAAGQARRCFGRFGADSGHFNHPRGLAVSGGHLLVADTGNDRVQVFDLEGNFQFYIWSYGSHDGAFDLPVAVAADEAGEIYTVDRGNCRVQKFSPGGELRRWWGGCGAFGGLLLRPEAIAVRHDRVVVADPGANRLVFFDSNGNYLGDRSGAVDRFEAVSAVALPPDRSEAIACDSLQRRCRAIPLESDVAFSTATSRAGFAISVTGGKLFLWSPDLGSVRVVDLAGEAPRFVAEFGSQGRERLQFLRPSAFLFEPKRHRLLVSDDGNRRLQLMELPARWRSDRHTSVVRPRLLQALDLADPEKLGVAPGVWRLEPAAIAPRGLTAVDRGEVALLDAASRRVVLLGQDWRPIADWNGAARPDGQWLDPIALAYDSRRQRLYIADAGRGRIELFLLDRSKLDPPASAGPSLRGDPIEPLVDLVAIAVDGSGTLCALDRARSRVICYGPDGSRSGAFGRSGNESGTDRLRDPEGIASDGRGHWIVADSGNRRLVAFDSTGRFVWELPYDAPVTRPER